MINKFAFILLLTFELIASVQSIESIQLLKQLDELENLSAVGYAAYVDQFGRPLNAYNQILNPGACQRNAYGQFVNYQYYPVPVRTLSVPTYINRYG